MDNSKMDNKVIYIVSVVRSETNNEIIIDYMSKDMLDKTLKLSVPYKNVISVTKGGNNQDGTTKKEPYIKNYDIDDFINSVNRYIKEHKFLKVAIDKESNIYIYPETINFTVEKTKKAVEDKEKAVVTEEHKPKPSISPFMMNELYKSMRISFLSMMNSLPKFEYSYDYLASLIDKQEVSKETLNIKKIKIGVASYIDSFVRYNLKTLLGKQYTHIVDEKIDQAIINLLNGIDKNELNDRLKQVMSEENVKKRSEKSYQQLPIQPESENKIYEQISASICSLLKTKNLTIKDYRSRINEYELAQLHTLLDSIYISEIAVPLIKPFYSDFIINTTNNILDNIAAINAEIWQRSSAPVSFTSQVDF